MTESLNTATEPTRTQIRRWRRYLAEERMEARTYRALAEQRTGEERQVLLGLAEAEGRHEEYWLSLLGEHALPAPHPPLRTRISAMLAYMFGTIFVLAMAQRTEQRSSYEDDDDAPAQMAADERIHGEVVRSLAERSRQTLAGTFRAAVFGINDGLVSNLALILGVVGAGMTTSNILTTGIAGLLAGALSMAAGEWVSVRSQRELLDASIPDPEADRSLPSLDVDANELALLFRARGEDAEHADAHAAEVFRQLAEAEGRVGEEAGDVRAIRRPIFASQNEEGAGASEEVGTPIRAAASSFVFFAAGALLPLIPYILGLNGMLAAGVAVGLVGFALMFTGGIVGVLSGRPPAPRALRQLLIGFGAAGATFALGLLFETSVA